MGEVKMWNYAITATSVVSYYNSTAARYGQTPVAQSLLFNGTQGQPLFVNGNTGDWALGTNGTIEWWEKISSTASSYFGNFNGGILAQGNAGAGLGTNGIDIFAAGAPGTGINSNVGGDITTSWPELTTGTWIHVAMSISSGLQQFYYNGVAQNQTDGNRGVNLRNALDTLRVGNRVPGANYQNFTGLISNLHISTATLYTDNFISTIRTTATTGTVLLLDCYNPTVDLSYYELNGLNTSASNGLNIYFSTSTYPNLINQIQVGNRITSPNTSTIGTVTGPVTLADPSNWGVPVTNLPEPGPLNFSGARHTTTGTVTLTTDAPRPPTEFVFQNAGFNYSVDGVLGSFPGLNLIRGRIYYFNLTNITSSHPLAFRVSNGSTSTVSVMIGNDPVGGHYGGGTIATTIVYQVPLDAPSMIYYQCVYHAGMIGTISITNS
jgi:hypothetical protein